MKEKWLNRKNSEQIYCGEFDTHLRRNEQRESQKEYKSPIKNIFRQIDNCEKQRKTTENDNGNFIKAGKFVLIHRKKLQKRR